MPMCFHPRGADWGEQYYPDMLCDTSGYPVRMCVVGSIAASDIRPVNDTHSEAAVEIELFRLEDIESMIELHTRANPPDGEHGSSRPSNSRLTICSRATGVPLGIERFP